jgi:hypothetical protein
MEKVMLHLTQLELPLLDSTHQRMDKVHCLPLLAMAANRDSNVLFTHATTPVQTGSRAKSLMKEQILSM